MNSVLQIDRQPKTVRRTNVLLFSIAVVFGGIGFVFPVMAQGFFLNYERLSLLEEPLATEIGDVTFVLAGLMETPFSIGVDSDRDWNAGFDGSSQITAMTQLPNRWRVRLNYLARFDSEEATGSKLSGRYSDNAVLSVGGVWGTVIGGNVSGIVREQTRRLRGAGFTSLVFDDILGELEDWSGGYYGRFGPWVLSSIVDEDANFDLGAVFQRPIGTRDLRLTARIANAVYVSADEHRFDSRALGGVVELIHGSTSFDVGAGMERFTSDLLDVDRWYITSGVRTKTGVNVLSLEGHYGTIEGETEASAAIGYQYDLARGLSLNLRLNYQKSRLSLDDIVFIDTKGTTAISTIRYSF